MKKFKQRLSRVLGGSGCEDAAADEEKSRVVKNGGCRNDENHTNNNKDHLDYLDKRRQWDRSREEMGSRLSKGKSEFFPGFEAFQYCPQQDATAMASTASVEAVKAKSKYRWSLSDSLSQLGERIAEMTVEEEGGAAAGPSGTHGTRMGNGTNWWNNRQQQQQQQPPEQRPQPPQYSHVGTSSGLTGESKPVIIMRNKKQQQQRQQPQPQQQQQRQQNTNKHKSWHASRWFGNFGTNSNSSKMIGSDGESVEVSPSGSEQHSASSCSTGSGSGGGGSVGGGTADFYVPNVKMRQKKGKKMAGEGEGHQQQQQEKMENRNRWNQEQIQKRLSLPAYINIPQSLVEKLNRGVMPLTPSTTTAFLGDGNNIDEDADGPHFSRKSRRASLSEIGFGKLETYKKIFDLGEGTYATVFLGQSMLTGKSVALKEIRLEHDEGAPCTAIREVSLLRNLKHANIVTLHDIVHTDSVLTLVFEYVEQDLGEYMEALDAPMSIGNVRLFLMQLLRGLAYCHTRRILHRDLKPKNLLITKGGELKLADFGLARAQSIPTKTYSSEVVTLWYRPPDVLLGSTDYTTHIDMWAVGCIFYEMLTHEPMFPGGTPQGQLNLIFRRLGTPTAQWHPELAKKCREFRIYSPKSLLSAPRMDEQRADLLEKLLKYDGKQRLSAEQAMRHPFLQCFPEELFHLRDTESIYTLPGIQFLEDKKRIHIHNNILDTKGGVGRGGLTASERLLLADLIAGMGAATGGKDTK